ncbi:MAG TPA: B-4DMT family transporter [Mycobacterium sp.]|nr:B-4DMT family transporter [Mycobacterium sp.]
MSKWLLRGLVFAALMVFIRLVQGTAINIWETKAGLISVTLVVLFAIAVFAWGVIDGRGDARKNPDPDRRDDLAMTWLLAGLFAGLVSGAVAWLISLFYKDLYVGGLINELTTFAAFTALLTFVFAIVGVALGRWLIDRNRPDEPRKRDGEPAGDDDRADTDVFAAVRHPDAPADDTTTERRQQQQT